VRFVDDVHLVAFVARRGVHRALAELTRIAAAYLRARNLTAILEPGRYIVASSGLLLARVTTKRVSAGMEWIGVDTGFNHLVRPSKYSAYHHILNATRGSSASLRASWDPMVERDEVVVVHLCAWTAKLELGVDGLHGPEELNRLVDEMSAQVEEQPTCVVSVLSPAGSDLGAPALESGLEPKNASEFVV